MRSICVYIFFFILSFGTIYAEENPKSVPLTEKTTPAPQVDALNKTGAEKKQAPPNSYFSEEEAQQEKTTVQETHFGELLVRMLLILAVTIVALIIVSWLAKRFLYSRMQELNRSSRIQILEKRTLSPKSMLYIIKIDEEELAIVEFPNGVQLLKVLLK